MAETAALRIGKDAAHKHPFMFVLDLILQKKILAMWVAMGIIIHQSLRFIIAPFIGDLTEAGVKNGDIEAVKYYAGLILTLSIISAFFDMTMSWGNEILANDVELNTRSIYFKSIQEKSLAFHDSSKTGELMAIAQNDMRSLYSAMAPGVRIMGESIISMVTITIIIFLENVVLGALFLLMLPLWILALRIYAKRLTPVAIDQQNNYRKLSAEVQENLAAAEVVRAFTQEEKEVNNFDKYNEGYTDSWVKRGNIVALYFPMLATYFMGGILFILAAILAGNPTINFAGIEYSHDFGLAGIVTIIVLIIQLRGPAMQINFVLEFWSLGLAGIQKVQQIIAIQDELPVVKNPIMKSITGNIELDSVFFRYNTGTNILSNLTFSVNQGEIVAIVGATGSGKSTLLKLLTRLYDITAGSIKIDNVDIRNFDPDMLRHEIAVVEQDIFLFSTTIRENITYALDEDQYNEEDIEKVIKQSRVSEFVYQLPNGLEKVVGERGVRLSGGQKQRVAIARAFLVDPKILILDDATSAIDGKTENEIVSALKDLMVGRTTFLVTNRLNMIRQADKVLVLEDGTITGIGTHDNLIKTNKIYSRIFDPHMELRERKEK